MHHFYQNIKQHKCLLILKIYIWALNQHIKIIFEALYDTENWSNGYWKFSSAITEINNILQYIKVENSYLKLQSYFFTRFQFLV